MRPDLIKNFLFCLIGASKSILPFLEDSILHFIPFDDEAHEFTFEQKIAHSLPKAFALKLREKETLSLIREATASNQSLGDELKIRKVWSEMLKEFSRLKTNDRSTDLKLFMRFHPNIDEFMLDSTESSIERLILAFMTGAPLLLTEPKGSGKKFALNHLAKRTQKPHQSIVWINAGDQTDARSLIGSYVCGNVPGEFKWVPGLLYKCMLESLACC